LFSLSRRLIARRSLKEKITSSAPLNGNEPRDFIFFCMARATIARVIKITKRILKETNGEIPSTEKKSRRRPARKEPHAPAAPNTKK